MMRQKIIFISILLSGYFLHAQEKNISGIVCDSLTMEPISGATVLLTIDGKREMTDEMGRFVFSNISRSINTLLFSAMGFQTQQLTLDCGSEKKMIRLVRRASTLSDVVITGSIKNPYKVLAESDIAMRGVSNSQEILRMVPGLFIGQHQGGGKAEQIFLRGFDADHGTDIRLSVDGIPINMVSHVHAQGYADSHFIIPETVEKANFNKGPYDAEKGDLATAGYLDFHTYNTLPKNTLTLEAGQFQTFRALAMINLLDDRKNYQKASWYAASEFSFTNGYFDNPQNFKRLNVFTKFNYRLSKKTRLTISASTFSSNWFASGQLPERAVVKGIVGYYGTLDANEGGVTTRSNINVQFRTSFHNGDILKNQFFYSHYTFDDHSNFTFFLVDSINGDEIRQKESRNLFGYNGSFTKIRKWRDIKFTTILGINIRYDIVQPSTLQHTRDRYTLLKTEKLGNIAELGSGLYIDETVQLNSNWYIKAGLRFDHFFYRYHNRLETDDNFPGIGTFKWRNKVFSPKISLHYQPTSSIQYYFSMGKGFHTNDARVVVKETSSQTLPSAYATDLGIIYKPAKNLLIQAALWYIYLQKEYVYAADGGTVDFSGRTRRKGVDVSIRYQPAWLIYFDVDINYAHGRAIDEIKGNDYIPLAPVWSSTAGITIVSKIGWNASLRYRYLSKRPANEDYSLTCAGYFVNDLVIKHKNNQFEYGIIVNNFFNVRWRETQFDTVSKLKEEQLPVNDIAFTAGTKFAAKLTVSYFFGPRVKK